MTIKVSPKPKAAPAPSSIPAEVSVKAVLHNEKAKAELVAYLGKGKPKAATKPKPAKKAKPEPVPKPEGAKLRAAPGEYALCRNLAGGDMAAGILLHRIAVLWKLLKKKLSRGGREWLAFSREDWARTAGLSEGEFKNRALPILRKECSSFLETMQARIVPTGPKLLWISIDTEAMAGAVMPQDMYEMALNGLGIMPKKPKYPYGKGSE